ncbi:MAG TPA: hypothetical protein PLA63_09215 [Tenuifilum sp.]|nr:hypothetical protein [Tenuifilum sp.]
MKKYVFFLILMFAITMQLLASSNDTIPAFIGIWYTPKMNWYVNFIQHKAIGKPLEVDFNTSSMMSVEGNFGIRRIGLRLGLNAQFENNAISKAYRWGGYLGFKGYWLKIQRSNISGTLYWTGELPPGDFRSQTSFDNPYFNIDILKTFKKKRYIDGKWVLDVVENNMGFYWGIGYTSMGFPVEIATLTTEGNFPDDLKFGKPAYDSLYKIRSFNLSGGFDLLRQLCQVGGRYGLIPGQPPMKLAVYASTEDRIGFGPGKLTSRSIQMAEALNPGRTVTSSSFFNVNVHYFLSVGLRYYIKSGPSLIVFAAGYDFEGTAFTPFGANTRKKEDLGLDFAGVLLNHGFTFKMYIAFDRRWNDME